MFGSLGFTELMVIFAVALIVFGPRRLPEIGKSIGKALGEFRRATTELKTTLEEEVRIEDSKIAAQPTPAAPSDTVPTAAPPPSIPAVPTQTADSGTNS